MANRTKFTDRARERFLAVLRETCNVSEAARAVGLSRTRVYGLRRLDEAFAAEWDEAEQEAADRLEREAWRRAVEGTERPVFYQGAECGYIREYSDTLMTLLLKAHRPEKYKDRVESQLTGKDGKELQGGVLVVPGIVKDTAQWEQQATAQQAALKQRARTDGGDTE